MTLGLWPDAVPFDPDSGTASHDLREHHDPGTLPAAVLLVCSRTLRGSEWPARTAIGLARALADGDRKVVLADLDFEQPSLHEWTGEPNGEGVADALLFGASLERVTLQPAAEPFEFVPAGAFAPDPAELMAHGAWPRIFAELATRNAILLAYAPIGAAGLDSIAERISAVIILAGPDEVTQTVAVLPETIRVEGVIRPAAQPPAEEAPPEAGSAESGPGATEQAVFGERAEAVQPPATQFDAVSGSPGPQSPDPASGAPGGPNAEPAYEPQPVAARPEATDEPVTTPSAAVAVSEAADDTTLPSSLPARGSVQKYVRIGVAVAGLAAIGWLAGRLIAGRSEAEIATSPAVLAASPAEPAGQLLGFSVAIEAYDRLSAAASRADSLSLLEPALSFYVAPVMIDEMLWYRVLAGPLGDSLSAGEAARSLADRGLRLASTSWDVRSTPLAFLIGVYEVRVDAVLRMNELKAQNVPTYIVEVPYTKGAPRFHVYAGAYSGPSEAEAMRGLLRSAGIQDTLVLRLGHNSP